MYNLSIDSRLCVNLHLLRLTDLHYAALFLFATLRKPYDPDNARVRTHFYCLGATSSGFMCRFNPNGGLIPDVMIGRPRPSRCLAVPGPR